MLYARYCVRIKLDGVYKMSSNPNAIIPTSEVKNWGLG